MFATHGVKQRGGIRPFLSNVSLPAIAVFKTNDVILVEGFAILDFDKFQYLVPWVL
jgi:hypothetical protein